MKKENNSAAESLARRTGRNGAVWNLTGGTGRNKVVWNLVRTLLLCLLFTTVLCGTALASQAKDTDIEYPVGDGILYFDKATGTITRSTGNVGPDLLIPREIDGTPVTAIGNYAFQSYSHIKTLKNIIIPDTVRTIGEEAFFRCGLTSVTIPDSVTEIGKCAFGQCASLTTAVISPNLEELPEEMFDGCPRLKTVVFPSGLKRVGRSAFNKCFSLESVQLPDSVTHIKENAFSDSGLADIPRPASLEEVGSRAFAYCKNLSHVTVPAGVRLGARLFEQSSLYSVYIEDGVTEIPDGMFGWCYNLYKIRVPDSVTRIGEDAFMACNSLSSVVIPKSVTEIGGSAFYGDPITSLTIPRSVTSLGVNSLTVFGSDRKKTDIYYEGTRAELTAIPHLDWTGINGDPNYNTTSLHYNSPVSDTEYLQPVQEPFADVPENSYFALPVQWAAAANVTGGTTPTTFSPYDTCTMAQAVAFLWRAAGRPDWWDDDVNLPNVPKNAYYADAAHRVYECGGIGSDFQPNAPCTRVALVDMLWKINQSREYGALIPIGIPYNDIAESDRVYYRDYAAVFTDVPADSPYATAIGWALCNGVTNGTSDTTFTPDKVCTRAQVVSILFRANGKALLNMG